MYLAHYNLAEKPFQITTDPKFLWLGEKHQEALAMLKYAVLDNKGFLLLTGDVGTGKTTLINALQKDLDSNTIVASVVDPKLEKLEFFDFLANVFKIEKELTNKADFIIHFTKFLNNTYLANKKVLLIIDEAQTLSLELLEEIRLLSNIEKENTKLLNIFFVGQNEFEKTLTQKESRALRQRITTTYQINPLTESETTQYIKYRLKVAGTEKKIFNRKAIIEIYAFSRGYPRLINIICDHVLLTGYVRGLKTIDAAIVRECAQELTLPEEIKMAPVQEHPPMEKQKKRHLRRAAVFSCFLLLTAFFGSVFTLFGFSDYIKNHYSQLFGSLEGLRSRYTTGKIQVQEPQQALMSRPVSRPKEHEAGMPAMTGNAGSEESPTYTDNMQAHRSNDATLADGRPDAVIVEEEITDVPKPDPPAPTLPTRARPASPIGGRASQWQAGLKGESFLFGDLKLIIPFNFDTNQLAVGAYNSLDRLAAAMVRNREIEVVVKGYTDTLGAHDYNKKLSELRANTVKTYLVAKGISPLRIRDIGKGEENPVEPNMTAAGRAANRRVEIELHRPE